MDCCVTGIPALNRQLTAGVHDPALANSLDRPMRLARALLAVGAGLTTSGCLSIQAIEPVLAPPARFQADVSVDVEFLPPGQVGLRCAERGAKFLGLPGINASACANASLVTMLDPCMTITAGSYAEAVCASRLAATPRHSDATSNSAGQLVRISSSSGKSSQPTRNGVAAAIRVHFVDQVQLAATCQAQNLQLMGELTSQYCAGAEVLTLANPCRSPNPGWYERTLCHELAHVNGWAADHSDNRSHVPLPLARQSPEARAMAALTSPDTSSKR
jgi:hypothetical protein